MIEHAFFEGYRRGNSACLCLENRKVKNEFSTSHHQLIRRHRRNDGAHISREKKKKKKKEKEKEKAVSIFPCKHALKSVCLST